MGIAKDLRVFEKLSRDLGLQILWVLLFSFFGVVVCLTLGIGVPLWDSIHCQLLLDGSKLLLLGTILLVIIWFGLLFLYKFWVIIGVSFEYKVGCPELCQVCEARRWVCEF